MKRIFASIILLLSLSLLPLKVVAQNIEQGDNVVLAKSEVVNKDYFAAGNSVSLEGTVNGDAYLAGGNIIVDGTINGDLLAAGGNIDIRGTVTGNIRTAGGNLNISGTVGRNITLAGGSINLASSANITGSLTAAGGNINILSPIGKEATLAGGQITIGNKVGGDVNAATGKLVLAPNTQVLGNVTYLSQDKASISNEATISGQITQNIPKNRGAEEQAKKGFVALISFFKIASIILTAIIGTLFIKFLPFFFGRVTELIVKKPWVSLGIGFLTVIAFPFIFLLLLFTVIGIPVALLLTVTLAVYFYLAKIFVAFVIGEMVLRRFVKNAGKIWVFLSGLIIYYIVAFIPIVGWLTSSITALIGVGAILIAKKDYYKELRIKQIV